MSSQVQVNFNSFEINGRIRYRLARDEMVMNPDGTWSRHIHPGLTPSLIYGLRTVVVEERFLAKSRRDGVDFADFGGNLDIDTENFMIGFQVGGDLVKRDEKFEYGVDMKFASLVNFAFADIDAVSNDNITGLTPVDLHQRATEANMAFLGEVDFGVKYYFHPDWSIGSNVEMTWIQGIAVATRQRNDFNSNFGAPPSVDVSANAFYLGLSVGLTGKW